jgi:hypothetical protein
LPKIENRAGNISPIQSGFDIPFKIERVFYLYDIPGGKDRGAHAHKECHQFLIAGSGSFDVLVDDGKNKRTFSLKFGLLRWDFHQGQSVLLLILITMMRMIT